MNGIHRFTHQGRYFVVRKSTLTLFEERRSFIPFLNRKQPISSVRYNYTRNFKKEINNKFESNDQGCEYLFLNISHICNMRCVYCFANTGNYGGKLSLMKEDVAKLALDSVFANARAPEIVINFFGGEPLLNEQILHLSVSYAKKLANTHNKNIVFIVTTNATRNLLRIGKILQNTKHSICVSIDGDEKTHNKNRPLKNSKTNSYKLVYDNIKTYGEKFSLNNITAKATWRLHDNDLIKTVESIVKLGIFNIYLSKETQFTNSFIPSVEQNISDFQIILRSYNELAKWYVEKLNLGIKLLIRPLYTIFRALLLSEIIRYRCMAGYKERCITPSGDIFPCHRFVGNNDYLIGSVYKKVLNRVLIKKLEKAERYTHSECNKCWAEYWCFSNRCLYQNIKLNQELHEVNEKEFCSFMKDLLELMCFHVSNLNSVALATLGCNNYVLNS